jgi:2-amino-4-hydroxy-6-hydroxymethyldihydropteridine diphosphokinase
MAIVYLGLGSNSDSEENLRLCMRELRQRFDVWSVSCVYRNEALGFSGADFLNAVACIETTCSPLEVYRVLDDIHDLAARIRSSDAFVSRTLDIDLLLYDDLIRHEPPVRVPREDVLAYAFVLGPLAEIAPTYVHPQTGKSLQSHWDELDKSAHPLSKAALIL